jgi:hypothetical protein
MDNSYKRYASEVYVDTKFASLTSTDLNLTDEQKAQARENIGATTEDRVNELIEEVLGNIPNAEDLIITWRGAWK